MARYTTGDYHPRSGLSPGDGSLPFLTALGFSSGVQLRKSEILQVQNTAINTGPTTSGLSPQEDGVTLSSPLEAGAIISFPTPVCMDQKNSYLQPYFVVIVKLHPIVLSALGAQSWSATSRPATSTMLSLILQLSGRLGSLLYYARGLVLR
ncbi:hypothetical protein DFJ43DRAFT_1151501 [Lentinula guzmanii]|uniref:Uncharacterized protein n=1 Tax=Lentinula guzmanii TaxID=2804957 RepID=A0AA38N2N3_9AGAR|nr:hypothetical protein DFJ43DRAFT_1151501 [Lentinula guzmanii]